MSRMSNKQICPNCIRATPLGGGRIFTLTSFTMGINKPGNSKGKYLLQPYEKADHKCLRSPQLLFKSRTQKEHHLNVSILLFFFSLFEVEKKVTASSDI